MSFWKIAVEIQYNKYTVVKHFKNEPSKTLCLSQAFVENGYVRKLDVSKFSIGIVSGLQIEATSYGSVANSH